MEDGQSYQAGYASDNSQYIDYNILRLRLDTDSVLKPIEMYLKGERLILTCDASGNPQETVFQETEPKANIAGINSIMSWLRVTMSTQSVQGYIKDFDALNVKLAEIREDMLQDILINCVYWDISDNHIEGIIDLICTSLSLYLSRLVGNKERESYAQTFKMTEQANYMGGKGNFKLPFTN